MRAAVTTALTITNRIISNIHRLIDELFDHIAQQSRYSKALDKLEQQVIVLEDLQGFVSGSADLV
eukprot:7628953-Heterocapsa_arctica.AAC.1